MGVFGHFGKFGIFGQFWGFLAKSVFLHISGPPGFRGPDGDASRPSIRITGHVITDMSIHGFDIMNDATPPGPRRKFDHPPVQIFGVGHLSSIIVSMMRPRWSRWHTVENGATNLFHVVSVTNIEDSQKRCRSFELKRTVGRGSCRCQQNRRMTFTGKPPCMEMMTGIGVEKCPAHISIEVVPTV